MEPSKKELDIVNFNKQFEESDIKNNKYQEKEYIIKDKPHPNKNNIDKIILKMRLAFDFLLNKLIKMENPIKEIINNEELLQGTIYFLFFIGSMTLILSGLMKE